jgi:hypothetical protein
VGRNVSEESGGFNLRVRYIEDEGKCFLRNGSACLRNIYVLAVLNWSTQTLFLLESEEILKYFLVLIPTCVSCKSQQLFFTHSDNVGFLFVSLPCRHILKPLP